MQPSRSVETVATEAGVKYDAHQSRLLDTWPEIVVEGVDTSHRAATWLHACESQPSKKLLEKADRFAKSAGPVLIMGECGTGKMQLAHHIQSQSSKNSPQIIRVACGKIASKIAQGKSDRARSWYALLDRYGETPDITWLFENVDEIPLSLQSFFSGLVDEILSSAMCRSQPILLSTATCGLIDALDEGRFREDLFYKLNVLELTIPALRDRKEDIAPLVNHFLSKLQDGEKVAKRFTSEAISVLCEHHWQGNVVELRNVVSRICVLSERTVIDSEQLLVHWRFPQTSRKDLSDLNLEDAETYLILEAVARCEGNKTAAAKRLGITTRTLHNKMQKYRRLGFVK